MSKATSSHKMLASCREARIVVLDRAANGTGNAAKITIKCVVYIHPTVQLHHACHPYLRMGGQLTAAWLGLVPRKILTWIPWWIRRHNGSPATAVMQVQLAISKEFKPLFFTTFDHQPHGNDRGLQDELEGVGSFWSS